MAGSETGISLLSILRWSEKQDEEGGGGGRAKVQVSGGKSGKKYSVWNRSFSSSKSGANTGQRFSGSKINNIVKARFVGVGSDSKRHITDHIKYIHEREKGKEEPEREFHSRYQSGHSREEVTEKMLENQGEHASMFKLILSPKQNELDHVEYTREIMSRWEDQTGIYSDWYFTEHKNTEHHHVHIVMAGKDIFGSSFEMTQEHLDCFRELANEHQYELQDRDYDFDRLVEREFGDERDDAELLMKHLHGPQYEKQLDREDKRELGLYNPDIDRRAEPILQKDEYFDADKFAKDIDDKRLNDAYIETLQEKRPDVLEGYDLDSPEFDSGKTMGEIRENHPEIFISSREDETGQRAEILSSLCEKVPDLVAMQPDWRESEGPEIPSPLDITYDEDRTQLDEPEARTEPGNRLEDKLFDNISTSTDSTFEPSQERDESNSASFLYDMNSSLGDTFDRGDSSSERTDTTSLSDRGDRGDRGDDDSNSFSRGDR